MVKKYYVYLTFFIMSRLYSAQPQDLTHKLLCDQIAIKQRIDRGQYCDLNAFEQSLKDAMLRGLNINTQINGLSLLFAAVAQDILPLVALLLRYGADVNQVVITQDGYHATPLFKAMERGNYLMIALLLQYRADPNATHATLKLMTPLHAAAINHRLDLCRLLVSYGAHITFINALGYKPGDYLSHVEIEYLLNLPDAI